jgi:hypothetical protein
VLEQAEAKLFFDRVVNDKVMSGDLEEPDVFDYFEDEFHDPTMTQWRSFDIVYDQKKTRFVFIRLTGWCYDVGFDKVCLLQRR